MIQKTDLLIIGAGWQAGNFRGGWWDHHRVGCGECKTL